MFDDINIFKFFVKSFKLLLIDSDALSEMSLKILLINALVYNDFDLLALTSRLVTRPFSSLSTRSLDFLLSSDKVSSYFKV